MNNIKGDCWNPTQGKVVLLFVGFGNGLDATLRNGKN
jgi:hypothetical protein